MAKAAQLFSKKADVYRSGRTHYPKAIASIPVSYTHLTLPTT